MVENLINISHIVLDLWKKSYTGNEMNPLQETTLYNLYALFWKIYN